MSDTDNQEETASNSWKLFMFFGVIVLIAIICAGVAVDQYSTHFSGGITTEHDRWGTFGDFFGGTLNPIFSFLSLIALLVTLVIQSKELALSTKELKKTTEALQDQGRSLKQQNFENTFFKMVTLHHEILNSLVTNVSGRHCLVNLANSIADSISKDIDLLADGLSRDDTGKSTWPELAEKLNELFASQGSSLTHYFRNLYRIFLFIDDQELDIKQKRIYSGILRAQLSRGELLTLFYNGLHDDGTKFKPLIEKYALFDNLDLGALGFKALLIPLYENEAYGSQDPCEPRESYV